MIEDGKVISKRKESMTKAELIAALEAKEAALTDWQVANLDLRADRDRLQQLLDGERIKGGLLDKEIDDLREQVYAAEQAERRGEITIEEQLHAIEAQRERIYSLRADIRDAEAESQTWEKAFESTLNKLTGLAGVASAAMANKVRTL
jgi:chromosome segregation ATPase